MKTAVKGAARGKLKGRRIALKDNVCLAGVPMMNGTSTLEGYVPDLDATVATRILDAGGEIAGKAVCLRRGAAPRVRRLRGAGRRERGRHWRQRLSKKIPAG